MANICCAACIIITSASCVSDCEVNIFIISFLQLEKVEPRLSNAYYITQELKVTSLGFTPQIRKCSFYKVAQSRIIANTIILR